MILKQIIYLTFHEFQFCLSTRQSQGFVYPAGGVYSFSFPKKSERLTFLSKAFKNGKPLMPITKIYICANDFKKQRCLLKHDQMQMRPIFLFPIILSGRYANTTCVEHRREDAKLAGDSLPKPWGQIWKK